MTTDLVPHKESSAQGVVLMEDALKAHPSDFQKYVQQFIGRWFITYAEMGVPRERQFQTSEEELRACRGPAYELLKGYAEEVARRFAHYPSACVLRAWQLGVMGYADEKSSYPQFDISVLLGWLRKYISKAITDLYPDGWPGQKRLVEKNPPTLALPPAEKYDRRKLYAELLELQTLNYDLFKMKLAIPIWDDLWSDMWAWLVKR